MAETPSRPSRSATATQATLPRPSASVARRLPLAAEPSQRLGMRSLAVALATTARSLTEGARLGFFCCRVTTPEYHDTPSRPASPCDLLARLVGQQRTKNGE